PVPATAIDGWRLRTGDGPHAGNGGDVAFHRLERRAGTVVVRVSRLRQHDVEHEQVVGVEADRNGRERERAANQQARADEQHERQTQLTDDEDLTEPMLAFAARVPTAVSECLLKIEPGRT